MGFEGRRVGDGGTRRPGKRRASSQGAKARPGNRRVAQWARDYVRLPGIPDEYIGQDGAPRAVWTRFFDAFASLSPSDIERRFGSADRHLREAGVTYRAPGETADRLWPLSHLPLLIDEADWQQLTRRHRAARANCWNWCWATSMARAAWWPRARYPPRPLPAAPNICARCAASNRRAAAISASMPPMSGAGPTGAGGCWATAPRRRRARAMRWKTGWCCRAPLPRSTNP